MFHLDRREGLSVGYKTSFLRLSGATRRFLATPRSSADFIAELEDLDDFGLAVWVFCFGGKKHEPFDALAANHAVIWDDCASHFRL